MGTIRNGEDGPTSTPMGRLRIATNRQGPAQLTNTLRRNPVVQHANISNWDCADDEGLLLAVRHASVRLETFCRSHDWTGFDPYDALNSELFAKTPLVESR